MKQWFQKLGYKIARFMYGRYGNDELSYALLIVTLILLLMAYLPYLWFCSFLAFAVMIWSMVRTFSKNHARRRRELAIYQKISYRPKNFFKLQKNKWRDRKTHCYFKCPKCKAVLRVPKGKGEIIVTCPRCNDRIEKHT